MMKDGRVLQGRTSWGYLYLLVETVYEDIPYTQHGYSRKELGVVVVVAGKILDLCTIALQAARNVSLWFHCPG